MSERGMNARKLQSIASIIRGWKPFCPIVPKKAIFSKGSFPAHHVKLSVYMSMYLEVCTSHLLTHRIHYYSQVNEFQGRIRDTTRRMMATVSELSMHQATALKLQQEKMARERELQEAT